MSTDDERDVVPTIETVSFTTSDGVVIEGDLASVDGAIAGAIVCHPHPQYGGNRHNNVVEALFDALPRAGVTSLRFDFRSEFGGGVAEQLDAVAALDTVAGAGSGVPLFAVGYSFGAMVTLALGDERLSGKALVAPPLGVMDLAPGRDMPTLVLTPAHDQFAPPSVAEPIVSTWADATFETIESVDHFVAGRAALVAERVATWITRPGYFHPGWK
ncbi:alpha/beta hydrolase [Ilumatobacter coccineus]|jgi:uncharacterized protein|uniref:Alpha/beta hydrolase n=1 Tax=Ilumatobacter coccineus (strain NBRC 103263 / KCTC 29153 / YM16-304) TaxID=1313172 RepID=A0A6C7E992_ILUCY|nr:hypothetical protein [Ilumatobacter coccineus]BAN02582.1 hypothetical protein YM304_22680 [Ilumatobacter coccineus YM16-304]